MKNHKVLTSIFSAIVLLVFVLSRANADSRITDSYKGEKGNLHIYLLIGQSNMAGRAPYSKQESEVIPRCYLLNNTNQWEPADNPLNRYSTIRKNLGMQKMNPGYYFAKTMLTNNINISIGLVVNAKGGTKIEQWEKGTHFYDEAVRRTKIAQKTGVLKGILWHQGESNQNDSDGYLIKLEKLVKDLRTDLDLPDLPFVAGQVNNVTNINNQIADLPGKVQHTAYTSSEGLKTMDRWHFDSPSMKLLGERYAQQMIRLQKTDY